MTWTQAEKAIEITVEDIRLGVARDCEECPAALACMRAFPDKIVMIAPTRLYLYELERSPEDNTLILDSVWRHDAGEFIGAFDNEFPVEPRIVKLVRINEGE